MITEFEACGMINTFGLRINIFEILNSQQIVQF